MSVQKKTHTAHVKLYTDNAEARNNVTVSRSNDDRFPVEIALHSRYDGTYSVTISVEEMQALREFFAEVIAG